MKKLLGVILLLACIKMQAQTITIRNESRVLLSNVIFYLRDGQEVMGSFYGKWTIEVPEGAVKFRIVSPAAYRNVSTNSRDIQISTQDVPIMTFDDLVLRVTLDGSRDNAQSAQLLVQEL